MHKHFADWYREAVLSPTNEMLEKRSEAVENVVSSAVPEDVLDLVRLLFTLSLQGKDFRDRFCQAFADVDSTFPMRGNERELSVLAGAAIAGIIAEEGDMANLAALAMVCAHFLFQRPEPPIDDIFNIATEYLSIQAAQLRKNATFDYFELAETDVNTNLQALLQTAKAKENTPQPQLAQTLIAGILENLTAVKALTASMNSLAERLDLLSEESNIIWWIFAGISRDLEKKMDELNFSASCLVAGKELADLVERIPGPLAAKAFLDKIISSRKPGRPQKIQIKEAINHTPREWREKFCREESLDLLGTICPINLAAKTSLLTEDLDDWLPVYLTDFRQFEKLS